MALFSDKSGSDRAAERRVAQEQVFLREVDDALREDDAARLVRRYGTIVGSAIVAGLAGLAGWMVWTNHAQAQIGQKGEAFAVALDQVEGNRWDAARTSLDQIAASSGPGYAAAARLVAGGALLDQKKPDDAVRLFDAVANDPTAPQAYRDLALVRSVATKFDSLPPKTVIDRLKPLAVPGSAWFGSAGELVAVAQLKLDHKAEAGALFAAMAKDKGVPASLQQRSRQLAVQLGADPGEEPTAAAAPALAQ